MYKLINGRKTTLSKAQLMVCWLNGSINMCFYSKNKITITILQLLVIDAPNLQFSKILGTFSRTFDRLLFTNFTCGALE